MELITSEAFKQKITQWPRIIPSRPVMPSDEVIEKRIEWNRSIERMMLYGPERRPTIYLADKRGRIQETITVGPTQKTIGFQQFMETYADDDAVTTEGQ